MATRGEIVLLLDAVDCLLNDAHQLCVGAFGDMKSISKIQGYMLGIDAQGRRLNRKIPSDLSPSGNYKHAMLKQGLWVCAQAWTSGNAWAR